MIRIRCLHGPNLNLLGSREPTHYGSLSLAEIDRELVKRGEALGAEVQCTQHNGEGELVTAVQGAAGADGLLINAGAYTHTSVALRDAFLAIRRPFIEVHLSNVFAREPFRHHSHLADIAVGVISGLGMDSYLLGLEALVRHLRRKE
ncbi:MAG: type II 3-dehydroquinate dehydratase [Nitrospirota bacterium]|jgi:3-dehydroquinate dehydratase-2